MNKLNLLSSDYMVVNLHIPQLKDREKQICDLVGDRMVAFYKEEKEKLNTTGSLFAGLFVSFKKTDNVEFLNQSLTSTDFIVKTFLQRLCTALMEILQSSRVRFRTRTANCNTFSKEPKIWHNKLGAGK